MAGEGGKSERRAWPRLCPAHNSRAFLSFTARVSHTPLLLLPMSARIPARVGTVARPGTLGEQEDGVVWGADCANPHR